MTSFATFEPTRENSSCKKPESVREVVACNIAIRRPSSTPWGWGWMSVVALGSSLVERSYVTSVPSGSL
jgi:hypothetical protein